MKQKPYNNLTKSERTSMKKISERRDIIITKAEEGGAVVIVAVKDSDKRSWTTNKQDRKLQKTSRRPNSNKHEISKGLNRKIQETKTNKWKSRWRPEKKWLKNILSTTKNILKRNPSRPVVSSVNCHTVNFSKYVNHRHQPIVKEIPSYVKDTQDFPKKL